jgi:2'-5' RNA ligase
MDEHPQLPEHAASGGGVSLRLFTALALPGDVAAGLGEHAELLASRSAGCVAIEAPELHVTFAFLGTVPEEYLPAVASAVDAAARDVPGPSGCIVRGISAYGDGRVLAADVDVELLAVMASARDRFIDSVRPYARTVERRGWQPHVTLLRAPDGIALPPITREDVAAAASVAWVSSELRLYASVPGPMGSLYRQVHAVPFGEPALFGRS